MITSGSTATSAAVFAAAAVRGASVDAYAAPLGGEGAVMCTMIMAPSTGTSSGTTSGTDSSNTSLATPSGV
jgi:hypothetical protein